MKSIWIDDVKFPCFDKLEGEIKTDVLIIGGGIAGILCGYMIKQAGIDCTVVEANTICSGITKNTTAKITCQHGLVYSQMIKRFGIDFAQLYIEAQQEALNIYRQMSEKIPCDFENKDSYVYSVDKRQIIEEELKALERLGAKPVFTPQIPLPVSVKGAVGIKNQAQFNPLNFLCAVSKELKIFENTKVKELTPHGAICENGKIKAEKIIVATHFPFLNKHGSYFLKMYQHRSYVIGYKNLPEVDGMFVDENKKGMSFRDYGDVVLIGGGSHRTGKDGGAWREISEFTTKNFPDAKEVCRFATQDCMTLDDIPYIGQYSKSTPNLYVATGFNKWGMTSAMVSGIILKDLVQGKENKYKKVFSPSRSMLRPQLMVNAVDSLLGMVTPTTPRCPHLGCALKYNKQEHSWDCPCHGSRFDKNGNLIDNPSTDDINIKKNNH